MGWNGQKHIFFPGTPALVLADLGGSTGKSTEQLHWLRFVYRRSKREDGEGTWHESYFMQDPKLPKPKETTTMPAQLGQGE